MPGMGCLVHPGGGGSLEAEGEMQGAVGGGCQHSVFPRLSVHAFKEQQDPKAGGGGASLFAHDAKVYAVTVHYSGIKGSKDNTSWAFDLSTFYNGR